MTGAYAPATSRIVLLGSVLFAAGCGGGGQTAAVPARQAGVPSPIVDATAAPAGSSSIALKIVIPSAGGRAASSRKRPAFVDPGTTLLTFAQNGGPVQNVPLASGSPGCSTDGSGARTCDVLLPATTGASQAFAFKMYANAAGTGTPLSLATVVHDVVAGQANPIAIALNGVATATTVAFAQPSLPFGKSGSVAVVVNALDAAGNTIVGPGVYDDASGNPVTIALSLTDPSASTTLSATSAAAPGTAISLAYDGGATQSVAVAAQLGSLAPSSATLALACNATPATSSLFVAGDFSPTSRGFERLPLGASGVDPAPGGRVTFPSTSDASLDDIAVDGNGFTYVVGDTFGANTVTPFVLGYCPDADGTPPPYRGIAGATVPQNNSFQTNFAAVAVDAKRNVYALAPTTLSEFAADNTSAGAPTSKSTPTPALRTITGLTNASAIAVGPDATAFVGTGDAVQTFGATKSGAAAPDTTIKDLAGGLLFPLRTATDATNVYVLYQSDNRTAPGAGDYGSYAIATYPKSSGSGAPTAVISGPVTDLGTDLGTSYEPNCCRPLALAVGPDGTLYVTVYSVDTSNVFHNSVLEFGPGASGNATPVRAFRLNQIEYRPAALAVDANSNIYIGDSGSNAGVVELEADGTFVRQIEMGSTGIGVTTGVAVDSAGDLTLSSHRFTSTSSTTIGTTGIFTFTQTQSSTSAPARSFVPAGGEYLGQIAYDGGDRLFALLGYNQTTPNEIEVFPAAASGSVMPARGFADTFEFDNDGADGLSVDPAGNTFLAGIDAQTVWQYSPAVSGQNVPHANAYASLGGSTLGTHLATDTKGDLYVASSTTDSVAIYTPGTLTPSHVIVGTETQLLYPYSVSVDANGIIYVVSGDSGLVTAYTGTGGSDEVPIRSFIAASTGFFDAVAVGPGTPTASTMAGPRAPAFASSRSARAARAASDARTTRQNRSRCATFASHARPAGATNAVEAAAGCNDVRP